MDKCVITCAITGAETTRKENPALPLSPAEIADAAADACRAGASVLHLHVRDTDGKPTQDVGVFRETMELVRRKCDIVIEVTTGGAVGMTPGERLAPVTLDPEMASLDCGSVNFADDYLVNTLPVMREFASAMAARRVRPTLECFDLSHIYGARKLIAEGLVTEPFHFGLVLNVPGGVPFTPDIMAFFLRSRVSFKFHKSRDNGLVMLRSFNPEVFKQLFQKLFLFAFHSINPIPGISPQDL